MAEQQSTALNLREKMLAMSKEQLVDWYFKSTEHHNRFCQEAHTWKVAMCKMAEALAPFAEHADELEDEHFDAAAFGGYVPLEPEISVITVKNENLFSARNALRTAPVDHVHQFNETIRGVRICIEALKKLEAQGNTIAAKALTEVRQIDPYV